MGVSPIQVVHLADQESRNMFARKLQQDFVIPEHLLSFLLKSSYADRHWLPDDWQLQSHHNHSRIFAVQIVIWMQQALRLPTYQIARRGADHCSGRRKAYSCDGVGLLLFRLFFCYTYYPELSNYYICIHANYSVFLEPTALIFAFMFSMLRVFTSSIWFRSNRYFSPFSE